MRSFPQSKDYRVFKQGLDKFGGRGGQEGDRVSPSNGHSNKKLEVGAASAELSTANRRSPIEVTASGQTGRSEAYNGQWPRGGSEVRENTAGTVYSVKSEARGQAEQGPVANGEVDSGHRYDVHQSFTSNGPKTDQDEKAAAAAGQENSAAGLAAGAENGGKAAGSSEQKASFESQRHARKQELTIQTHFKRH